MIKKVKEKARRTSRLSSKNQLTLPVAIMRSAGVSPGDSFQIQVEGPGAISIHLANKAVDEVAGSLTGVYPKDALEKLRAEWP
jgi:bifunctional DNA-binding transcriptional regulator/antitoxin component of YhaV-PrlF toxin-antitoxin module